MQYIIATHSKLAEGFKETLEFIAGKQDNVSVFTAYIDGCKNFEDKIDELIYNSIEKNIVVFTDLFGGSVNNHMMSLLQKDKRIHLITGVNLPLIITLTSSLADGDIVHGIRNAIKEAQNGIIYCNDINETNFDSNLDEF